MSTQLSLLSPQPTTDPHADARTLVRHAITTAAALHHGIVSPNAVRVRLRGLTLPRGLVGAVYRAMRCEGLLVPEGWESSDDIAGGNNGKPSRTYRLVTP